MLTALYMKTAPHPPTATPLFGIAPFLAMSLSACASAALLGANQTTIGRAMSLLAVFCAMVSFGPQKYLDAQFSLIWPAVVTGQVASLVLVINLFGRQRTEIAT